jgi:hypothetical protein
MTTNLALPLREWSVVSTNYFNPDGSFSNAVPASPDSPQAYYQLQMW